MARRADGRVKGQRRTSTQKCSVIESGSGYGKVVLPRMSKQPQRLWVYGVRKPKVVCLCAALPMHGSAHCETMYNGRWTADRTHVAWVTCVEKGGQARKFRENGMELFAAFAGLAPARGGRAVALAWKGLRPDAGCSMRFRARRGGGLSAAAAAVGTLSCCRPVPASGCRYRAAAGDVVSAACGRGSGRVDVVV